MQNSISIEQPDPSFLETSRKDIWWIGLFFYDGWAAGLRCLFDMGSISEWTLSMGFLSLFLLCTVAWIRLVAFFAGISDPQGSIRISAHLILLPKSISPVALSDTIGLRGGRKTSELPWWTVLLLFQNLHRYFLYLVLVFCVILSYDVILSFSFEDGLGEGVGTVV